MRELLKHGNTVKTASTDDHAVDKFLVADYITTQRWVVIT